jgi:hypothetical protein
MSSFKATDVTYDGAAFIHVISALVMPKSLPAKELMTVIEPVKKLDMATAIVTDMTNRHSCSVDLKHSGRALGSLSLIGGETSLPSAASFSGSSFAICCVQIVQREFTCLCEAKKKNAVLSMSHYVG